MTKIFAISGGHQIGKTTLCHEISSELGRQGFNAGYIQEAVRRSQFMFKGDRSLQMHIETLMLHIIEEVTASSVFDVLICDRSAIDYLAYANLRFDKQKDSTLYETISATVSSYSSVYEKIFILSSTPELKTYGNFRSGENTNSINVSDECLRLCKKLGAQFEHVALEPSAERSSYVLGKILNCLTSQI